jgi:alkyl hydroperoxide reductase subunit AhpC
MIKPEFDRRHVKIIGLVRGPVENHEKWASDIAETQGAGPNYPLIGEVDFTVSKLYGMLPADTSGDPTQRTRPRTRPCAPCSSSARTKGSSSASPTR